MYILLTEKMEELKMLIEQAKGKFTLMLNNFLLLLYNYNNGLKTYLQY
jgi:hypothetical protein